MEKISSDTGSYPFPPPIFQEHLRFPAIPPAGTQGLSHEYTSLDRTWFVVDIKSVKHPSIESGGTCIFRQALKRVKSASFRRPLPALTAAAIGIALVSGCASSGSTGNSSADNTRDEQETAATHQSFRPGATTYHIEGTRVDSVDVYGLGSYTNRAFREADFIGGRIID